MKMLLPLGFFLFTLTGCPAQDQKPVQDKPKMDVSFINNQTIKRTIVLMACRDCAPIRSVGYRVVVTLSAEEQAKIARINPATWLALLGDSTTDFSANLILYSLYEKDAIVLAQNNSPELWHRYRKERDVAFWQDTFKTQTPPASPH